MRVFAIGDLHLSSCTEKPMDVFGPRWADHAARIERNWRRVVRSEDLVLLPGDLSWAMRLEEALPDLALIESLPGTKFFIRGNHDYWLSSPAKVRAALGPSMHLVRFDAHVFSGVGICGVRGWPWPGHPEYDPREDERHWLRAVARLRLSLDALSSLDWACAVAMPARGRTRRRVRRGARRRRIPVRKRGQDRFRTRAAVPALDSATRRLTSPRGPGCGPSPNRRGWGALQA